MALVFNIILFKADFLFRYYYIFNYYYFLIARGNSFSMSSIVKWNLNSDQLSHGSNKGLWLVSHIIGGFKPKIPQVLTASGWNFLDLSPPLKFGPYRWKCWYFVPKSNYKVQIFPKFKPPSPYFGRLPNLTHDVDWGGP